MDSKTVQSQVHVNDEHHPHNVDSQQVTHGAEEHYPDPEKKSGLILNKVKAKARKVKDSIMKHGQQVLDHAGYNSEHHQHTPDDRDLDEEDKEMVEDPKVHGAPINESEATPASEQVENLDKSGINIGGTKVVGEEPHHDPLVGGVSSNTEVNQNIATTDPAKTFAAEEKPGQCNKVDLERPIVLEEDPHKQGSGAEAYNTLPNYQTKVTDPSGAGGDKIEDIALVEESFERTSVQDERKPTREQEIQPTGANIEYPSAEAYPLPNYQTKVTDSRGAGGDKIEDIASVEESFERTNVHDERKPTQEQEIQPTGAKTEYPSAEAYPLPNYQTKVTDSRGAGDDKIEDIAPVEESFERTNVQDERKPTREQEIQPTGAKTEYPSVEAYPLPNYQTKVTDSRGADGDEIEDKDISPVEESFERMNVHNEPKPTPELKIQPATVADTEYPPEGSHDQFVPHLSAATETQNEYPQETISTNINTNPEIPSETGQTFNTITTPVEEQPRYESVETQPRQNSYTDKTLSPESDEASKLGYDEKGDRNDQVTSHDEQQKSGNASNMSGSSGEQGKNYLAEKLRPGEEDKALSEVISESLYKRKEEPVEEEHGHLGSEDEKSGKAPEESSVKSPGKGVVDKVKGYVGSWFAKPGENQSPHVAGSEDLSENKTSVTEVEQVSQVVDESRIQE